MFVLNAHRWRIICCLLVALIAHVVVFGTFSIANPYGAEDEGEGGFEVGIGLAAPQPPVLLENPITELSERPNIETPIVETHLILVESPPITQLPAISTPVQQPIVFQQPSEFEHALDFDSMRDRMRQDLNMHVGYGRGTTAGYGGNQGTQNSYAAQVSDQLNRYKIYPHEARLAGQEGIVYLKLTIRRDGQVTSHQIQESSGYPSLDNAVIELVERASPFRAFPETLRTSSLEFLIPVTFSIE